MSLPKSDKKIQFWNSVNKLNEKRICLVLQTFGIFLVFPLGCKTCYTHNDDMVPMCFESLTTFSRMMIIIIKSVENGDLSALGHTVDFLPRWLLDRAANFLFTYSSAYFPFPSAATINLHKTLDCFSCYCNITNTPQAQNSSVPSFYLREPLSVSK